MRISDWSSDVCSSDLPRGQRGFEEVVDVAVQHALGVALLHCGAQVLHHLVGLQHVGANLVTPADIGLRVGLGLGRRLALLQFVLVERSEEHTSELKSLMRISYAVFCLKKKRCMPDNILDICNKIILMKKHTPRLVY